MSSALLALLICNWRGTVTICRICTQLWAQLSAGVHGNAITIKLNCNDSLLRRFSQEEALDALRTLSAQRVRRCGVWSLVPAARQRQSSSCSWASLLTESEPLTSTLQHD